MYSFLEAADYEIGFEDYVWLQKRSSERFIFLNGILTSSKT